ncbi:MAG: alpha-L-rhamnosidase C-terminal domain-containing protein, partial [Mucilaginibacter sp.]
YHSLFGQIRSEWEISGKGQLKMLIEIPVNTSATFVLPPHRLKLIDESGKNIPAKKINGKYIAEFASGVYRFEVL